LHKELATKKENNFNRFGTIYPGILFNNHQLRK